MANCFFVNLFIGAKNGRAKLRVYFAAFAVVVERERFRAVRGEEFGVDDVAELEWQSKEGLVCVCWWPFLSLVFLCSSQTC